MSNHDLYFIPIIDAAMKRLHAPGALEYAFREIREVGSSPQNAQGYENFKVLMSKVESNAAAEGRLNTTSITLELWNEQMLITMLDSKKSTVHRVEQIVPGTYRIKTASGRLLWESNLDPNLIYWADAFPGKSLSVAADTHEDTEQHVSKRFSLFNGEIVVEIIPGIDSGSLIVEFKEDQSR